MRASSILPRMSTWQVAASPAGTRAKAMARLRVGENVPLVVTPEGLTVAHFGDQSHPDDFAWIDDVGRHHRVDVVLPNCWTTDIVRTVAGFRPAVVITGHENEMGHTIDHREPYWLTYQRQTGSDRFGGSKEVGYDTPLILMTWGRAYF